MRTAVAILLIVCACAVPLAGQDGGDARPYAGRSLVDVLQDLNRRGLRIVFSTSLVTAALRVSTEPSGTPRDVLDQVLKPHRLYARPGAQGVLIVARAPKRSDEPVPPIPHRLAQPAASDPPAPAADLSGRVHNESADQIRITEMTWVSSHQPIIDVQSAIVGTHFGTTMLRDIPNQRDVFALLAQTPGITMPRPDVGGNTAGTQSPYRAYGLSGQSITTVDGVNITAGADDVGAYVDYGAMAEVKVSAAANPVDVPVAGAAVATVIKSGGNALHGELYADYKPGGRKPYNGAEQYAQYRDLNGQLGGPVIKDKLWYFASFRDRHTELTTGMFDRPQDQGGVQGQPFPTQTTEYTLKLNHQVSGERTLTFMTQLGKKYQPYRGGSGTLAYQYPVESTARQDGRSHIGKIGFMQVIGNRATLDTSINVYGNNFPLTAHTDKTPIIDDVTLVRSGGYNRPSLSKDRRRHANADLNVYADRHELKAGYMYQRYAPRFLAYGAPGPAGTAGHFYITTSNGVPSAFWTDNGPAWSENVLGNHALFVQDRMSVTSRLTLNYGLRVDRYQSSYPEQRFGLNGDEPCVDDVNCTVGPFAARTVAPPRDVVTFNTLVPRVSLIYDVFGNSKTAVKASWGRFATNPAASIAALANPIDVTFKKYAWDGNYLTADTAIGAARITRAYVATLQPIQGGAQLTPTTLDPDLKNSYFDEFTLGAEQEIAGDVRAHVTVVRKQQKNTVGRYDRLRTTASFTPVKSLDPGPDGNFNSPDDRTITVWDTGVLPDTTDYLLTNKPIGDTYSTFEFGLIQRMSDRWQLTSGVDWTKRDVESEFSEDPNIVFWNSSNMETTGWTFKASGSYVFDRGVLVSLSYNGMKGEPHGRLFTVTDRHLRLADPTRTTPLAQGNMMIFADRIGTYYLPSIHLVNMRAQKEFVVKNSQRVQVMVNAFNLTDAETVTGLIQTTGALFRQPRTRISGIVIRFGARYTF